MSERVERILGSIETQLDSMDKRMTGIESKIDVLLAFKWKIIGATVAMSICSIGMIIFEVTRA